MIALSGGREGIVKVGDIVMRPANVWTPTIHQYLEYLHNHQVGFVPKPISLQGGVEQVSYVKGEVCNYPLNVEFTAESTLVSAAKLLRKLHDVSASFLTQLSGNEIWMLPAIEPQEVICHADYAPYNVTVKNAQTIGIIDFDTCHPGSRIWDIAYAIYRWAPLNRVGAADSFGTQQQQFVRAKIFLNAYGFSRAARAEVVATLVIRLQTMVAYIIRQAANGDKAFIANIDDGHHIHYRKDIEYIEANASLITAAIS
ncbi:MAG: aminoglycoside phosphotransferase family protein [Rhizobiales bacterium]|nr:aminoglycoside phosphotransferase family protein [Hyphomicrobiales bacterium]